jgi:hypothetical protein
LKRTDGIFEGPQPPIELCIGEPNHGTHFFELAVHSIFETLHPLVEPIDSRIHPVDALSIRDHPFGHELNLLSETLSDDIEMLSRLNGAIGDQPFQLFVTHPADHTSDRPQQDATRLLTSGHQC